MTESRQAQPLEIVVKIVAVKMKIKFPCRMALEYNKQPLTKEVPSGEAHKFIFNEDVTLRAEAETQSFDIMANLYTEKGTRYTSGIMKLLSAQLTRSQGQRLIIPLTKCLDPDAFCQIKVEQTSTISKSMLKLNRSNSKVLNSLQDMKGSTDSKKINSQKYLIAQTRSEVHSPPTPPLPISEEGRGREVAKTQIFKTFTKSPSSKYSNLKYLGISNQMKNMSEFPVEEVTSQRQSFAESEVIRQSYLKLKQKFKKESELAKEETHKRMLLEANQNNFKLEIMKLKLKTESQEKELADKNEKIKTISSQLSELQKKDIDMAYLKEECLSYQTKIKLNEDTLQTLNNQNQALKKLMNEKYKIKDESIAQLKHELEFALAKIEQQKHELDLQGKTKDAIILGKNNDLKMRGDTIDRQKKMIRELEDQAENKLFQFQKSLTAERTAFQSKIDDFKIKNSNLEKEKEDLKIKISLLQEQIEKHKNGFISLEYSKKLLGEEITALHKQIEELTVTKEKFSQLQKDNKLLEEQFVTVRKNLELSLQNKEVNINDLISKFDETKIRHEKSKNEAQEKAKNLIIKLQELQLTQNNTKTTLQKTNRTVQNQSKELSNLKKINNSLRQELKIAEKRIISLEGQHSSNFGKYERETANLKFLLEKYKDEKLALEKENDFFKEKNEKLEDLRLENERKESGWKLKERHYEEKAEKDGIKFKETLTKHEQINKDQENTILDLNVTVQTLNNDIRQLRKRLHEFELSQIKVKEKQERQRKDLKSKEEKISSMQFQLKQKSDDLLAQVQKYREQQFTLNQKELQIAKLKEDLVQENNKNTKQIQIADILKKDITKLNHLIVELQNTISSKEQVEDQLRNQIKSYREENAKEKIRGNKIQSEFQKFKEVINDIIRIELARMLVTPNPQRIAEKLKESQVSNSKSEASGRSRVKVPLDSGVLATTLGEKVHEVKNSLWKMAELNRAFKAQNTKLLQQFEFASNKHEFTKLELHRDIQQLQDQMNIIIDDKQSEVQNYDNLVIDLNGKIKQKELQIEEMKTEIDQYNAIITGLRTDFETNNDLNEKKVTALKSNITELNQRIQYLNLNVACLQDKNHELEEKVIELENQIILHKELLIKNEKTAIDAKENESSLSTKVDEMKKQLKSYQEIKEELEIQLNTEKEMKEKYMSLLQQEEKKSQKLNQFITGLIIQKETAIKHELEKSQEVNTLENKLFESTQKNQILQQDNQSLKKKNQENREELKNLTKNLKQLEKQLSEEKVKVNRSMEKIKERETDIEIKQEYIKDLEEKYRELRDKNYKEIKDLSNQLEDKNASSVNMNKELSDKILKLQTENKKYWEDSLVLKSEIQALTKDLHNKNDQIQDLRILVKKMEDERVNLDEELTSKEFILHERVDEIQKLQEIVEEQRISLSNINRQFETYQKQFDLNINDITNDFNYKIQTLEREYEQKIELEKKETEFLVEKLKPLEDELNKVLIEKKSEEIQNQQMKKMLEDKLKKLENQRLNNILVKNNEIKQLSEQSKANLSKLHEKDSEIRKLNLELQQLKLSTGRTQQFYTYSLEQSKNREKVLEKEVQSWKARQQNSINYKQSLLTSLFQNEVEVRKVLSAATKKIMESCSKNEADRISSILKGLETNVIHSMMAKIDSY